MRGSNDFPGIPFGKVLTRLKWNLEVQGGDYARGWKARFERELETLRLTGGATSATIAEIDKLLAQVRGGDASAQSGAVQGFSVEGFLGNLAMLGELQRRGITKKGDIYALGADGYIMMTVDPWRAGALNNPQLTPYKFPRLENSLDALLYLPRDAERGFEKVSCIGFTTLDRGVRDVLASRGRFFVGTSPRDNSPMNLYRREGRPTLHVL